MNNSIQMIKDFNSTRLEFPIILIFYNLSPGSWGIITDTEHRISLVSTEIYKELNVLSDKAISSEGCRKMMMTLPAALAW